MSGILCRQRLGWKLGLVIGGAIASSANCTNAQIIPDGTLPNNSNVAPSDNTRIIGGGTQAGSNLFHSFQQFSVPTGGTAYFNNALDIQNIISRVTGKSISDIDGLIQANGTANLFLINPNGIIFGKNASLNIGGSFVATTAQAIEFKNQGFFSADNLNTPELLTVNPSAFLFNQIAAPIQNNSAASAGVAPSGNESFGLRVRDGQSLLLVGGNIIMDRGVLNAFGGHIELGGLAGQGTVGLNTDNNLSLSFPNNVELADVLFTNAAEANVRANNGGSISITARNIDINNFSKLDGGLERNLGFPGAQAGDIKLHAQGIITLTNGFVSNTVDAGAVGNSGDINITADSLFLNDGAQLDTSILRQSSLLNPLTQGNAGNVNVNVRDTVSFDRKVGGIRFTTTGAFSRVEDRAVGNGGEINITARALLVKNGAVLDASNSGRGSAGTINLNARDTVSIDGDDSSVKLGTVDQNSVIGILSKENNISITTNSLSITNGAQVSTSTDGKRSAGDIIITASNVEVSGVSKNGNFFSRLTTSTGGDGAGGDLKITTGKLVIRDAGQVSSGTSSGSTGNGGTLIINAADSVEVSGFIIRKNGTVVSRLTTRTEGTGNANNLAIKTRKLVIRDGGQVSSGNVSWGTGNGGDLTVDASDSVEVIGKVNGPGGEIRSRLTNRTEDGITGNLSINTGDLIIRDRGEVGVNSLGKSARAGNLKVTARSIKLDNQGRLNARATSAVDGGNITLNVQDFLLLRRNSQISATADREGGSGNGGNITIYAPNGFIVAVPSENSDIAANASTGKGGRVEITAQSIFGLTPRSREELQTLLGTNDPTELNPANLSSSDITAISQTNPSLSGQVSLNAPDVDLIRSLVNLPAVLVDTEVAQACTAGGNVAKSEFTITGRGGLPPNPGEALSTDAVQVDLVTLNRKVQPSTAVSINSTSSKPAPIVEAQGLVINANGNMVLTANTPTVTPHTSWQNANCQKLKN